MNTGSVVYNDFAGLAKLEAEAKQRSPEATREAARQFESLFVQMMLKSMRTASAVLAEDRDTTYEEMFDQQIALDLTRNKGLGIADMMVRQMGGAAATDDGPAVDQSQLKDRISASARANPLPPAVNTPKASPIAGREDFRPDGPEGFLRKIWPMASAAAERLGIDPEAIAAQATLETGWGQRLIRDRAGVSGNNLFGIKADQRWTGDKVPVNTLEYENGLPRKQSAHFRAYPDLEAGFQDYVDFLTSNPRYQEATAGGLDPQGYAESLQRAGYATDPDYANKISDILDSPRFSRVVSELKNQGGRPTSL